MLKSKGSIKRKETRFKVRRDYLGWLLIAMSFALIVAGGVYYISTMGG